MNLLEAAAKFAEIGAALDGSHGGHRPFLEKGAALIREELGSGLSGVNRYGLPPLSASTIARKGDDQFLRETGALAESLRESIDEESATVGSNDEKISFLEHGTRRMPPRPVFLSARNAVAPKIYALAWEDTLKRFD